MSCLAGPACACKHYPDLRRANHWDLSPNTPEVRTHARPRERTNGPRSSVSSAASTVSAMLSGAPNAELGPV